MFRFLRAQLYLRTRPPGRTAAKNVDGPHRRWLWPRRAAKIDAMRAAEARASACQEMRGQVSRGARRALGVLGMEHGESVRPLGATLSGNSVGNAKMQKNRKETNHLMCTKRMISQL